MPKQYTTYKARLQDIKDRYAMSNTIQANAQVRIYVQDVLTDVSNKNCVSPHLLTKLALEAIALHSPIDVNYG